VTTSPEDALWPTFVVIGAMRAGTTTLYYQLLNHPEVVMAGVKEPNFFAFDGEQTDLPLTDEALQRMRANSVVDAGSYHQLFLRRRGAQAVGDVSPAYLYSSVAARQIRQVVPDIRLIAILRDPVDRAYSAYFRRADVDPDPGVFVETAEREHEKMERGDKLPLYPLIKGGLYSQHLPSYLDLFSSDRRMFCIFETFWNDHLSSLEEIHRFIGVSPIPATDVPSLNRSGVPRWSFVDQALRSGTRVKELTKRYLPNRAVSALVATKQAIEDWTLRESSELPEAARSYLMDTYFDTDIERVEDMLNRDLSIWRR
jgi:hypothetical protein